MADNDAPLAPEAGNPGENQGENNQGNNAPPQGDSAPNPSPPSDGGQPSGEVKGDWPENWRDMMAKGDDKLLKRLGRFKSPNDITKSFLAAEQRISSGDLKSRLPDDATDEQVAEYRKENGIPEKAEGYLEALPDGLVVGEADKPLVDGFLERAHRKNADPAVVADMIGWYYDNQEQALAAQAEADKAFKQNSEDALRAEWGNEYRGNMNALANFLDTAPSDENGTPMKELLLSGRLSDGSTIRDNPAVIKWLVDMADTANPAGFIAPGAGMSQIDTVESEIADIEKTMRTDRQSYNRDEKMQARYLSLLEAREKLK